MPTPSQVDRDIETKVKKVTLSLKVNTASGGESWEYVKYNGNTKCCDEDAEDTKRRLIKLS